MLSDWRETGAERRREERCDGGGFPLLSPAEATLVDCGPRGLGIETKAHLGVGGLTKVNVFLPTGQIELLGRVCWARLVGNKWLAEGESQPVFRAGLSLVEGQSLDAWDRLLGRLITPWSKHRGAARPKRRVIKWQPPGQRAAQRPE